MRAGLSSTREEICTMLLSFNFDGVCETLRKLRTNMLFGNFGVIRDTSQPFELDPSACFTLDCLHDHCSKLNTNFVNLCRNPLVNTVHCPISSSLQAHRGTCDCTQDNPHGRQCRTVSDSAVLEEGKLCTNSFCTKLPPCLMQHPSTNDVSHSRDAQQRRGTAP